MGFEPVIDSTTCSFMQRAVAQLVSVHVWGAWGRRFKSAQPDSITLSVEVNRNVVSCRQGFFCLAKLRGNSSTKG